MQIEQKMCKIYFALNSHVFILVVERNYGNYIAFGDLNSGEKINKTVIKTHRAPCSLHREGNPRQAE